MSFVNKHISKLAGANVLIIGGTAGVGYAVAEAVVEYGAASVILSSSNLDRVSASTSRLRCPIVDSKTCDEAHGTGPCIQYFVHLRNQRLSSLPQLECAGSLYRLIGGHGSKFGGGNEASARKPGLPWPR